MTEGGPEAGEILNVKAIKFILNTKIMWVGAGYKFWLLNSSTNYIIDRKSHSTCIYIRNGMTGNRNVAIAV